MIVQTRFTAEAEAAAQRYGVLVESWRGIYHRAIHDTRFGTQRLIVDVTSQAYAVARAFMDTERTIAEATFDEIAREALGETSRALGISDAVELTADADEHLEAAGEYLLRELSVQIERDIAFLVESIRKTYLAVSIAARARRVPFRSALLEYTIGNSSELHFFFHDRSNQKWPSRKFVRAIWRHGLLNTYNEIVLLTLADHGVDHAQVSHLDPNSRFEGMRVALFSGSHNPTYAEIRNEIFHPNSDAILSTVTDVSP